MSRVPSKAIVAKSADNEREQKVIDRFRSILCNKNARDIDGWVRDCGSTLRAAIRDDAVWIDRSQCFDTLPEAEKPSAADAAEHLFKMLGSKEDYFTTTDPEDDAADKNFNIKSGNWISRYWGEGRKSDARMIVRQLSRIMSIDRAKAVGIKGDLLVVQMLTILGESADNKLPEKAIRSLFAAIGWTGRPNTTRIALERVAWSNSVTDEEWNKFVSAACAERQERNTPAGEEDSSWTQELKRSLPSRVGMPFNPKCSRSLHFEFSTMLSFALRRVSQIHTKSKQAEDTRTTLDRGSSQTHLVPQAARSWLESFIDDRSLSSGSITGYQIRRRAIEGWEDVVEFWSRCSTPDERVDAVRELQQEREKFGDVQLFRDIADDNAKAVWQNNGEPDFNILRTFVTEHLAKNDALRLKVPAYRHPDPLRNPSFVGYGKSQWQCTYSALEEHKCRRKLMAQLKKNKRSESQNKIEEDLTNPRELQAVTLGVWDGTKIGEPKFKWQSLRFIRDLNLKSALGSSGESVARATRLGRSMTGSKPVVVSSIFDMEKWNGRLQVARRELEDLARRLDRLELSYEDERTWPPKLQNRLKHLGWFLSHSAKLMPKGPWLDYVKESLPEGCEWKKIRSDWRLVWDTNKSRKGRARRILSGLPNLRILSVDLGIRDSAAAAVWQVVSKKELDESKRDAKRVVEDGLCLRMTNGKNCTQIYRKIGNQSWARLERQFIIRLDGEGENARRATKEEWDAVNRLRQWLGGQTERGVLPCVDDLQDDAVRLCKNGLKRLSQLARVGYLLRSNEKPIMGGRLIQLDYAGRVAAVQDGLEIWYGLATSSECSDKFARDLWKQVVVAKYGGLALDDGLVTDGSATPSEQKKQREARLKPIAEKIVEKPYPELLIAIDCEWKARVDEWKLRLRWLRSWVMPRFSGKKAGDEASKKVRLTRNVGGLTLGRISTIRSVYDLMKMFSTRPEPGNLKAGVERIEKAAAKKIRPEFGRRMLAVMERLRDNRVKQIASRIVEAGLGVGSESYAHRGRKRPQTPIDDSRFAQCHAVVIENLKRYKPDQKRPRRENRGLMNWNARALSKFLGEGCRLHGLYFTEVSPYYTSRQDSRTGAPGIRCEDIPKRVFAVASDHSKEPVPLSQGGSVRWLKQQITKAAGAVSDGSATPRQQLIADIAKKIAEGKYVRDLIRLPANGGKIFVSARRDSPASSGLHADINAAANIGLVALLDPDWRGSWWRLPCKPANGKLDVAEVKGSSLMKSAITLLEIKKSKTGKPYVAAWSDTAISSFTDRGRKWQGRRVYWKDVEKRVVTLLRDWNLKAPQGAG